VKRNGLACYFRTRQDADGDVRAWLRSTTARRLLGAVAEGPVSAADLHRLIACSRSTAHGHLVRVERLGLVRRDRGLVSLTPKGLDAWQGLR
jgi:DNA-binding MarR family transcriptional regulator